MNSLKLLLLALCMHPFFFNYAGPVSQYMQYMQEQQNRPKGTNIQTLYFQQTIDHDNPSLGTFAQRYFIDETFSQDSQSPVFFYICGESACSDRALSGAIREYAKQFHAKLIALEHRFYGDSLPYNSFARDKLHYLSTKAALRDLANFQEKIIESRRWQGTWIAFGGSYPGSLSAYYRLYYPHLVAGALASSAPVRAKEDFFEYDAHVNKVVGKVCGQLMREVTQTVGSALENPPQLKQIKALFEASEVDDPIDFLYLIADTGAAAVQYGMKSEFCHALSTAQNPLEGYAQFARRLYQRMGVSAVDMTAQGALSENPRDYIGGVGMRQWFYQSCTEYGYWQNANPDASEATRSSLINLQYHHKLCKRLFGLKEPANTQVINTQFYYPLLDVSTTSIYFTNGEQDPWSALSLTKANDNADNPHLNYYLIEGAAHCDDLRVPKSSDSASLKAARQHMVALLEKWLNSSQTH